VTASHKKTGLIPTPLPFTTGRSQSSNDSLIWKGERLVIQFSRPHGHIIANLEPAQHVDILWGSAKTPVKKFYENSNEISSSKKKMDFFNYFRTYQGTCSIKK
jgi:hypothetical protein